MKKILAFGLIVQIIAIQIISHFPVFIEHWYSTYLYPIIAKINHFIFGSIPFSVGDCLYSIIVIMSSYWLLKNKSLFWTNRKQNSITILAFISIFYFLFHFLWGMNYYRIPITEKITITKKYNTTDLIAFTEQMIAQTNTIHSAITNNDTVAVNVPYTNTELFSIATNGYKNLPKNLSEFKYSKKSIKPSIFSLPLSYMGFGGYINPFTNEAQINTLKPNYSLPMTICHEIAHQTGIASETECNFVGAIAAINNNNNYFKYSGYCFIVRHCISHLEKIEKGKGIAFKNQLNKGVLKNFNESFQFKKQHKSFISDFFDDFYDSFLKINQQSEGIKSYTKFIGLLINYM